MWTQNATQIFSYDESIAGGLRKRRGTKGLKRRDYRKCQDLAFGASLKDSICLIRAKLTPNHTPGISDRGGHFHTGTILKRTQLSSSRVIGTNALTSVLQQLRSALASVGGAQRWIQLPCDVHLSNCRLSTASATSLEMH